MLFEFYKHCLVLQLSRNCLNNQLIEILPINGSNVQTSKIAVQVILWVSLLVWFQSLEPREALIFILIRIR